MEDEKILELNEELKRKSIEFDQYFFGHGKLLLSGEYFVLDGALSLAIPTRVGQSLSVRYAPSFSPKLYFKSYDMNGEMWFESTFEFWHFNCLDENPSKEALFLEKIFKEIRRQNPHFLRDEVDIFVKTQLGFPLDWGLGSSSTLIYNLAEWAYVSPFNLLEKTMGGSGYDIACAQSEGPILYQLEGKNPSWKFHPFFPSFHSHLFFVYLGTKQNSKEAIHFYFDKKKEGDGHEEALSLISNITREMCRCKSLADFKELMIRHEEIVGRYLGLQPVKEKLFPTLPIVVKSLGAWGGDFVMIAYDGNLEELRSLLGPRYKTIYSFQDLVLHPDMNSPSIKNAQSMGPISHLLH